MSLCQETVSPTGWETHLETRGGAAARRGRGRLWALGGSGPGLRDARGEGGGAPAGTGRLRALAGQGRAW